MSVAADTVSSYIHTVVYEGNSANDEFKVSKVSNTLYHKVRDIFLEYHSVCLLESSSEWDNPTPLPQASVSLPRKQKGGLTRQRERGWGSPNSDDWRNSLCSVLFTNEVYRSVLLGNLFLFVDSSYFVFFHYLQCWY